MYHGTSHTAHEWKLHKEHMQSIYRQGVSLTRGGGGDWTNKANHITVNQWNRKGRRIAVCVEGLLYVQKD